MGRGGSGILAGFKNPLDAASPGFDFAGAEEGVG
jgi:hypothetical protein